MSSRTNTPIWRTARTLTLMFWAGLALAPLSALLLLVGNSGTVIKLALIAGLGSVVLIGLSVTWRKDAASVERDLSTALADVEAETHQMVAELRSEMRGVTRGGPEPARRSVEAERPRPEALPVHESHHHSSPPRRAEYDSPEPPRRAEYDSPEPPRRAEYDSPEPPRRGYAEPATHNTQPRRSEAAYEDTGEMAQQSRRGRDEYDAAQARHREDDNRGRRREPAFEFDDHSGPAQRHRADAAYEDPGDMVRHTETVVTRHETMTTRSEEHEAYRNATPGPDGGVYRGSGKSSVADKFGKLRRSRDDESEQYQARQQADSLLSGLQAEPGHEDDWREGETMMVPQQRPSRRGYEPEDGSRGRRHRDADSSWHAEERSAELRMGVRQSRGGPADGWNEEPRSGSWSAETPRRRGRHYEEEEVEPTRAISSYEAEPQPRWRDYEQQQPSQSGAGSYMDQYYGGRSRRG